MRSQSTQHPSALPRYSPTRGGTRSWQRGTSQCSGATNNARKVICEEAASHGIAFQAHNLIIHAKFLRRAQLASLGSGLLLISAPGALL